jgi:hypothetical protein
MVMCHNGECRIGATIQSVLRWVKLKIKKLHKDRCDLRGNFVRLRHLLSPLGWRCSASPRATPGGFFWTCPRRARQAAAVISHSTLQASAERRRNVQCLQARPRGDRVQTALVAVPIRPLDGYNRRLRRRSRCIRLQIQQHIPSPTRGCLSATIAARPKTHKVTIDRIRMIRRTPRHLVKWRAVNALPDQRWGLLHPAAPGPLP